MCPGVKNPFPTLRPTYLTLYKWENTCWTDLLSVISGEVTEKWGAEALVYQCCFKLFYSKIIVIYYLCNEKK